jgi:hypothetical protein
MAASPHSSGSQINVADIPSAGPRNTRLGQEADVVTSKVIPQISHPTSTLHNQQGVLTESPDEGYEGEGIEGTEI